MGDTVNTVGELCANDLYTTKVTLQYGESTISGKLTELMHSAVDYSLVGPLAITVTLTVGGITVEGLPREHPCRLFRTNTV